jgi:tight adherence protein C
MTPIELSLLLLGGLLVSLTLYLALTLRASESRAVLTGYSSAPSEEFKTSGSLGVRVSQALPALDYLVVSSQREPMRKKLRRLGFSPATGSRAFAGIKLAGGVVLGLLGVALGSSVPAAGALLGVAFFALGVYLPDLVLDRRLQALESEVQLALPPAIDLLNICIRSGMNLERAIARVTQETTGPLGIDFQIITERASLGDSIEDAVRHLTAQQEISRASSSLLGTVSRATRLGVPLGNVIQQTADDMRKQQIDAIKTSAAKLPVKILLPLMLFLLPAVLLIVLGPAILSLIDGFAAL